MWTPKFNLIHCADHSRESSQTSLLCLSLELSYKVFVEGYWFTHHLFSYSSSLTDLAALQKRQFLIYLVYIYIEPFSGLTSRGKVRARDEKKRPHRPVHIAAHRNKTMDSGRCKYASPLLRVQWISNNYAKICCFGGAWCGNVLELSPLALVYIRFWSLRRDPCFFQLYLSLLFSGNGSSFLLSQTGELVGSFQRGAPPTTRGRCYCH